MKKHVEWKEMAKWGLQDVGDLEVWEGVFKDQGVYYNLNQGQISS